MDLDAQTIVDLLCRLFPYREETAVVRAGQPTRFRLLVEILADRPWESVDRDVLAGLAALLTGPTGSGKIGPDN